MSCGFQAYRLHEVLARDLFVFVFVFILTQNDVVTWRLCLMEEDFEIMPNLLDRRRLKDRIIESISKAVKNVRMGPIVSGTVCHHDNKNFGPWLRANTGKTAKHG